MDQRIPKKRHYDQRYQKATKVYERKQSNNQDWFFRFDGDSKTGFDHLTINDGTISSKNGHLLNIVPPSFFQDSIIKVYGSISKVVWEDPVIVNHENADWFQEKYCGLPNSYFKPDKIVVVFEVPGTNDACQDQHHVLEVPLDQTCWKNRSVHSLVAIEQPKTKKYGWNVQCD